MERLTGLWMLVEDGKNRIGKRRGRDMERFTYRFVDVGGRKERRE